MRTFVRKLGRSQRFWNILLGPWVITVSSGTSGPGEVTTFDIDSIEECKKEHDRLITEKLAEGYVETTDQPLSAAYDSPLRKALEVALAEDPDDLATHMAYADHLTELGDPRGEFISVQIALEDESLTAAQRKKLRQREQALLKRHERTWLGPMAGFWIDKLDSEHLESNAQRAHPFTWRRGWVDSLGFYDGYRHSAAAAVRRRDLLRCLRELRFYHAHRYDDSGPSEFLKADCFANVRVFQVGDDQSDQVYFSGYVPDREYFDKMPRLEELHNHAGIFWNQKLFARRMLHLRKLTVYHSREYPLEVLAANGWLVNLTHLACWPRSQINDGNGEAYIRPAAVAALVRSPNLLRLRYLELRSTDMGDEGMRTIVESGILKRLRGLHLRGGTVTDAGARILAACPDLRNLDTLDLSRNYLTADGIAALQATGVTLKCESQLGQRVGEPRYENHLWEGDCE